MASPGPAEEAGNQDSIPSAIAFDSQSNHPESTERPEFPKNVLMSIDTQPTRHSRSPSRPKLEEPLPSFSSIPEEFVPTNSVVGIGESETQEPAANYALSMAPMMDEINMQEPATDHDPAMAATIDETVVLDAARSNPPALDDSIQAQPRTFVMKKKLFKTPKERKIEAAKNERRVREAGALFHQSLIPNSPTLSAPQLIATALLSQSHENEDVEAAEGGHHRSAPIDIETEVESDAAAARFKSSKKNYERKKKRSQNTIEDDIVFSKARNAEEHRLKLKSRKRDYADVEDDESLFLDERSSPINLVPEGEDTETLTAPNERKRCRTNRIPESALQDATQIGSAALEALDRKRASKKRGPKASATKKIAKVSKAGVTKSKDKNATGTSKAKRARGGKGPEMTNIETLFHNDIVSAAQGNIGMAAQPGFTSRNKKNALAELIASIPEEERTTHNADKNALDKATKSFSGVGSMKADGQDGWRLKGMITSLYHYQLLGAAFMRERENSTTRPYGGLQSDEMGLGKTVTCLANIVDGQAPRNSPNRTTLIVCPSGLCSQWLSEIKKHVHPKTFQEVITYRAGARLESTDPVKTLSNMDIIITSYSEVMRSYPHCNSPRHLTTPEARTQWWADHFEVNRGVLHKIYFRRIVLDEAQAIKNHNSKTSLAIRSLLGKYRWAISGTPVQNSLEEFFPFFSFLKVPHTGSIETFRNNFVGRNKTTDLRLQTLLRHIMIRRTHLDKVFGRPLLQLPGITSNTITVEFNSCEKAIYKIVKNRFIAKICTYARSGELDKKFQSIFVLYLRLRQLVGHILLVQQTLKDLLEAEDLEKLWRLTESEVQPQGKDQAVLSQLRKMLLKTKDVQTTVSKEGIQGDTADTLTGNSATNEMVDDVGGTFGIDFRFRKYLRNLKETGKWEQTISRSLCHKCGGVPDNPHVTSCFHVYCKECIEDMLFNAAKAEREKAICLACDSEFEHCEPCRGFDEASNKVKFSLAGTPERRARKSADSDENDLDWLSVGGSILPSAKTLAVKAQIQNWVAEDPNAKIIIFTQFRPMIRILTRMMIEEGWGCSQFHGAMSFGARDKALQDFTDNPDKKVMLASLKAGGVGLNLTMASKVIIIDLWWNECVEQQAFCRCFRIGQTRPVDICRIVVKDTIDDDILAMQARKTSDIDMAMAAKNRPGKLSIQELVRLFGPMNVSEDGEDGTYTDPFILVEDEDDNDDKSDGEVPTRVPAPPFLYV